MKPLPLICGAACLAALIGCGPKTEEAPESEEKQTTSTSAGENAYENPPVGMLVSNDHQITIHTGPEGPLFSVKGPEGKQLAREISKKELQASFPDVNLQGLWAGLENPGSDSIKLDATNYLVVPKSAPR